MSLEIELDQKPVEFGDSSQNQPDFGELYDQYFHRLYAYLCYRLNSKQDAEDLVAETFLHAMRGIASFQQLHSHSFAAWLFRIAHNLLVSFHRQRGRWQDWLPLEEAEVVPAPSTQSPEEVLIKQEQSRELGRLLDSLAPRHKEVITLKYFGELRNQEIATILGLDERTVAAYLHRGLQELQRRYHLEHSSALPSGTLLPGRITPPASFSPILPQGGIMNSKQPQFWLAQPGNLTNLNYTPPRPYPMGQPGWAVGIEVGESLGSEEFSSDWLELLGLISYLKRVVPQADETLRLRLKGYLLAQLQHQPKPVPLNSRC